ncbi:protein-disulfide reductase DsbD domain-containing protein [Methylocystis sp. 9N]|uniref:Protein-disulfide reductase DsbD domain-containing protein n=1 Tax=Methylocystis borbori TaxID=3118750 RepID=A0ABU7XGG2_9HYPH
MTRLTFLLPALLVALTPASHAGDAPFASAAAKGALSSARLLSAGPPQAGVYRAGVEIDLDAGAITYWRQPGESGAPPVFDFSHSVNVAKVEPFFPAPKHIDEAGTTVAGYDSRVIFPLKVTPRDPGAPVKLNLALDYAACSKICLPGRADLSLDLPREGSSPHAADIAEAERLVPKKLTAGEAKKRLTLKRAEGDAAWRLVYLGPGKALDLFPEAPEPLFLDSKKVGDGFELTLFATGEKPKAADATLTIVTDQEAFEAPARLE